MNLQLLILKAIYSYYYLSFKLVSHSKNLIFNLLIIYYNCNFISCNSLEVVDVLCLNSRPYCQLRSLMKALPSMTDEL